MRKVFILSFLAFIFFTSFGNVASAQQNQGNIKSQVQVWNPTKVDWWVSMDKSDLSNQQSCQIHWLYDDAYDVMLEKNKEGRLFFTFRVTPKNKNIKPALTLREGMANKATLVIDNVKHSLGVTDINLPPLTVIMGVSSNLNDLNYIKDANRLLINVGNTVYNFPLENITENMQVFADCMKSLQTGAPVSANSKLQKPKPVIAPVVPAVAPKPQAVPAVAPLPYDNAVEIEQLPTPSKNKIEPDFKEDVLKPLDKAPPPKLSKQGDAMLGDAEYEGLQKDNLSQSKKTKAENCPAYDDESFAIIQNLTRKLSLLENEKEELRLRSIGSRNGRISEIMDCSAQELEATEDPYNEEIILKFEATIRNLRDENDLLKEALDSAEDLEDENNKKAEGADALQKQVNDLIKKNHDLQDEIFNYELEAEKKSTEIPVTPQKPDDLKKLLENQVQSKTKNKAVSE